ncbi:MAG: hypothetical protein J7604_07015 [Sporocytophaga sp.]|uniref:hypothetical protein n=1 Tax=Sporocytophaga sp. TaxID=2231183 RepID=UPI001B2EEA2E|nr:hypothetical protein [Sporocytophaga sp.]MBO9699943.1 hypothetical protein [Sporocytophaga sp.]
MVRKKMSDYNTSLREVSNFILEQKRSWKNYSINNSSSKATFIDIVTRKNVEITIEINITGKISIVADSDWLYFPGLSEDKVFANSQAAINYLKKILAEKKETPFSVKYNHRNKKANINLSSIDPHRQMGIERIYEIVIFDKGEEKVIAGVSEYPEGSYTVFEKDEKVEFRIEDFINHVLNIKE